MFSLLNMVPLKLLVLRLCFTQRQIVPHPYRKDLLVQSGGGGGAGFLEDEKRHFLTHYKKILELFCYLDTLSLAEQKVFFGDHL